MLHIDQESLTRFAAQVEKRESFYLTRRFPRRTGTLRSRRLEPGEPGLRTQLEESLTQINLKNARTRHQRVEER
jgi:hypothetical protein